MVSLNLNTYELQVLKDMKGTPLGPVTRYDGYFYLCDQNAIYRLKDGKVEMATRNVFSNHISGLVISGEKAYVSTIKGEVFVIDLGSDQLKTLAKFNGKIYEMKALQTESHEAYQDKVEDGKTNATSEVKTGKVTGRVSVTTTITERRDHLPITLLGVIAFILAFFLAWLITKLKGSR